MEFCHTNAARKFPHIQTTTSSINTMAAKAKRITYSESQLEQYYERIALPAPRRLFSVTALSAKDQLDHLAVLLKYHVIHVPFENLVQHYSWHRVINTDALHVFGKIVGQTGRGGYCMETNVLFHTVLLSLGFKCYTAQGRVRKADGWSSLSHLVNLVTVDDTIYLCDVGFGKNEPLQPVALGHGHMVSHIKLAQIRLVYQTIDEFLSDSKVWIYQVRANEQAEWEILYCFTEMEVMPEDIESMNYSPWIGRNSIFTRNVICVRYTVGERAEYEGTGAEHIEGHEIDGMLTMFNNHLTWTRNGKTLIESTFKSEDERVEALCRYWGIEIDVMDRKAIEGTITAI